MDRYALFRTALCSDLLVDPEQPITSDLTGRDVAKIMLARSALKKREVWPENMIEEQSRRALALFCESNSACAQWSWKPVHPMADLFRGELQSFLYDLLDVGVEPASACDLSNLAQLMGPGPGAAVGANSTNFYTKLFESPMTATSRYLFSLYRAATCERPYWAEAEEYRHRRYGFQEVTGSTYFSVAKNEEIQRSCATEPNVNMTFQKGLGKWIEDRLEKRLGLSLKHQPALNQMLARAGSISGEYATIDLKSASDRNAMDMVDYFFPASITRWIKLFRSPSCRLPDGTELKMAMCSSMGNGFTFPLQTALFVGVVASCYKLLGIPFFKNRAVTRVYHRPSEAIPIEKRYSAGNWAVFGDDIIVRKDAYEFVCEMLRSLGHTVNESKSFNSGDFRESCGCDYYRGYNVRGVYVKSLETPLDVYSAINRLTRWSAIHGVNLSHTLRLLFGWVKFLPVPFGAADHEGVKVPYDANRQIPIRRGDAEVAREARNTQSSVYRGCIVKTRTMVANYLMDPSETGNQKGDLDCPAVFDNQTGWALSALGGYAGTPPYCVSPEYLSECPPKRPQVVIGVRERGNEKPRWKVKLVAGHWPARPMLPGPEFGTDRGDEWAIVAGRHEFLSLLPRE